VCCWAGLGCWVLGLGVVGCVRCCVVLCCVMLFCVCVVCCWVVVGLSLAGLLLLCVLHLVGPFNRNVGSLVIVHFLGRRGKEVVVRGAHCTGTRIPTLPMV
jgi:hypothetical protein